MTDCFHLLNTALFYHHEINNLMVIFVSEVISVPQCVCGQTHTPNGRVHKQRVFKGCRILNTGVESLLPYCLVSAAGSSVFILAAAAAELPFAITTVPMANTLCSLGVLNTNSQCHSVCTCRVREQSAFPQHVRLCTQNSHFYRFCIRILWFSRLIWDKVR